MKSIDLAEAVLSALRSDNTAEARRLVCMLHGRLQATSSSDELTDEEVRLYQDNRRVACVRLVRDRTGLSFREAKNLIDRSIGGNGRR